jgi:hypothetical protein
LGIKGKRKRDFALHRSRLEVGLSFSKHRVVRKLKTLV